MITALFASFGIAGAEGSSAELVSSSTVQADERLKFTISVTNGSSDNIENVLIRPPEGTFSEAIGGQNSVDNLFVAVDNLENAVSTLNKLSDNIQLAADNIETAKTSLSKIKSNLEEAADRIGDYGDENQNDVSGYLFEAAFAIGDASTALDDGDFSPAAENLKNAGDNIKEAGLVPSTLEGTVWTYETQNKNFTDTVDPWENSTVSENTEVHFDDTNGWVTENNSSLENDTMKESWYNDVTVENWSGIKSATVDFAFKVDTWSSVDSNDNISVVIEDPSGDNHVASGITPGAGGWTTKTKDVSSYIDEDGTYRLFLHVEATEDSNDAGGTADVDVAWDNARLTIKPWESPEYALQFAGENLTNAGTNLGDGALDSFADNLDNAIGKLQSSSDNYNNAEHALLESASNYMNNAIEDFGTVQTAFGDASGYLSSAGTNLTTAHVSLDTAADNLEGVANLDEAGSALAEAASHIENAGENLSATPQDLFTARGELSSAADELAKVGDNLGKVLGGSYFLYMGSDPDYLGTAAENMKSGTVDLSTASGDLAESATQIGSAADKIRSTANDLAPANWTLYKGGNVGMKENDVVFRGIDENVITPESTEEFTYVWKTPDIAATKDYDLETWVYRRDDWYKVGTLTVSVEGSTPTIEEITVTQENVAVDNLVGTAYDNGKANLTITASEELENIGPVTIEDADNLLPPITRSDLSTTDNKTFTYEFTVENAWNDNSPVHVSIDSIVDLYGNDNSDVGLDDVFYVDTKAPIFLDNGLPGLEDDMGFEKLVAGTDNVCLTDNTADQRISGNLADNWNGARLGYENYARPTVLQAWASWNGNEVEVEDVITPDNGFAKDITLQKGLNDVTIEATDWTGNSVSYTLENIFIDTTKPSVSFDSLTSEAFDTVTWDENKKLTNDNTPKIGLTINDAGLGVAPENLTVWFDGDDNILNNSAADSWDSPDNGVKLDNASAYEWDVTAGATFENTLENAGGAFVDGTYWINVSASDNITHGARDNWYFSQSFEIDTSVPAEPSDFAGKGGRHYPSESQRIAERRGDRYRGNHESGRYRHDIRQRFEGARGHGR